MAARHLGPCERAVQPVAKRIGNRQPLARWDAVSDVDLTGRAAQPDASHLTLQRASGGLTGQLIGGMMHHVLKRLLAAGLLTVGLPISIAASQAHAATIAAPRAPHATSHMAVARAIALITSEPVTITNYFSGLCLDDYQFSTSNDTDIYQHTCDQLINQEWEFVPTSTSGIFTIKNQFSGLCLDDYQFSTSDGSPIVQHTCDGYTNQEWELRSYPGYPYVFVTNVFSNKVLDDYGFSATKNIIRQYHLDYYTNQQWIIG
jgi:hypothetical protein